MRFPRSFDLRWALAGSLAVHLLVMAFLRGQTPPPERLLEVDLSELPAKTPPPAIPTPRPVPTKAPQVLATPLAAPKPAPRIVQAPRPTLPPQPTAAPQPTLAPQPTSAPRPTAPPKSVTTPKMRVTIQKLKAPKSTTTRPKTSGRQFTPRPTDTGSSSALNRKPRTFKGQLAPLGKGKNAPRRDNEQAGSARDKQSRLASSLRATRPPGGERPAPFRNTQSDTNRAQNDASSSPSPRGLDSSHRAANALGNAAPRFDSRRFGTTSSAQDKALGDAQGGSSRGRNVELAGTSGAGGLILPHAVPRRGGDSAAARNSLLFASKSDDSAAKNSGVDVTPIKPGQRLAGRESGAGRSSGGGIGFANSGPNRAAFNPRPGGGIGATSGGGIGGAAGQRKSGGGEMAGGGSSGGGLRIGGSNGGNGRSGPRLAANGGTPFGGGGNGTGGVGNGNGTGKGGGPGGPGRGTRLARRDFGDGDGAGGAGPGGAGGRGGKGFGPGLSQGGGAGGGNGNGGAGGRNGRGAGGRGKGNGAGDGDEAGGGKRGDDGAGDGGSGRRLALERGRLKSSAEAGSKIGRGIFKPGLVGRYFQDPDQGALDPGHPIDWPVLGASGSKEVRTHTDQTIDFDWGINPPLKEMRGTYWSVIWKGSIFVPKDDEYRFFLEDVDDGGRLYLDGEKIIDVWKVQRSSPPTRGRIPLKTGPHEIKLEYVQGPATASSVRLMWESLSFPRELVGSYIPGS